MIFFIFVKWCDIFLFLTHYPSHSSMDIQYEFFFSNSDLMCFQSFPLFFDSMLWSPAHAEKETDIHIIWLMYISNVVQDGSAWKEPTLFVCSVRLILDFFLMLHKFYPITTYYYYEDTYDCMIQHRFTFWVCYPC